MIYGRLITLLLGAFMLASCQDIFVAPSSSKRADAVDATFSYTGKAYIYESNPIIASGNANLNYPRMKEYVSARFVTNETKLQTACEFDSFSTGDGNCFKVLNDLSSSSTPLQITNGGWNYSIGSDEFYQINTFYHVNKMIGRFMEGLSSAHTTLFNSGDTGVPTATKYDFKGSKSFWFANATRDPYDPNLILQLENSGLKVYSKCYLDPFNAYYSPAENKICLGWNDDREWLFAAQDPSVIYHELGHALVKVMMNQRNSAAGNFGSYNATPFKSDLGHLSYDEASAINEGVADWFSYYMTNRTHFGEWALGKFFNASRAMTETDEIYDGLVSKASGERLAYPEYLYYDPNSPESKTEDSHYAGQIVSHYLVSLTEELKSCSTGTTLNKHQEASNRVLMLLNETFAELGDMTGRGTDAFDEFLMGSSNYDKTGAFFTNLNNQESYRWSHQVNPPNFRRFFQTFARNLKYRVINSGICSSFSLDESEQLLDEYGLLLFENYGDFKKGVELNPVDNYVTATDTNYSDWFYSLYAACFIDSGKAYADNFCPLLGSSSVDELNRRHTVLVSKDLLEYRTDDEDVTPTYVLDSRSDIESYLSYLTFEGSAVQVSEGSAGVEYNNNDISIGPGEIVGIMLNLFNNSNTTIGGVQILANDWDHMKLLDSSEDYVNRIENKTAGLDTAHWAPCQIDGWPLATENGQIDADEDNPQEGDCGYSSRTNFVMYDETGSDNTKYYQDAPQPVCMVQYSADDETQWVAQDFYRKTVLDLGAEKCLNPPSYSGEDFNPNECLIRFLPGADQAILGKIDPQKSYTQTISDGETSEDITIDSNNILLMEINKEVTPGTIFTCRLRARFSNCSDCYKNEETGEEFAEYEMTGASPFKVINFRFTVN